LERLHVITLAVKKNYSNYAIKAMQRKHLHIRKSLMQIATDSLDILKNEIRILLEFLFHLLIFLISRKREIKSKKNVFATMQYEKKSIDTGKLHLSCASGR